MHAASTSVSSYEVCQQRVRETCFHDVLHPPGLNVLSSSSSAEFSEHLLEGLDGECLFRAEDPKVSHSLHNI